MNIIAIDPGTSNTGVVYMDQYRVIYAATLPGKDHPTINRDQYSLFHRSVFIAERITDWIADKSHDAVVIEGFQSWGHSNNSNSHQTPVLVGHIQNALKRENLIIQTSDIFQLKKGSIYASLGVLEEAKNLRAKGHTPMKLRAWLVDEFLESNGRLNDHQRAAACHGLHYLRGLKNDTTHQR